MAPENPQSQFLSQTPQIYDNTQREIIYIMPDTLDNKLRDFENGIKTKGNIFNDLGLSAAFLITLVTVSQFRDFIQIPADVWHAIIIVLFILSIFKLGRDVFFNCRKTLKREDLLKHLLTETKRKE